MKPRYLDSSIVIPYVSGLVGTREQQRSEINRKAVRYISTCRAPLKIGVATLAETLRHFPDSAAATVLGETFTAPLPLLPRHARRWARMQNRSGRVMGDNDAWIAAQAIEDGGVVVGHDKQAFHDRPDVEYIDFLKA
jgi:predicted nucleic acid-binding protein